MSTSTAVAAVASTVPLAALEVATQAEPWLRLQKESSAAYARFCEYRDQPVGERSLARLSCAKRLAERWSSRYKWQLRIAAWDDAVQALADKLSRKRTLEARIVHADAGSAAVRKSLAGIGALDATKLGAADAVLLLKAGVEIERQALGINNEPSPANAGAGSSLINVNVGAPWLQVARINGDNVNVENNKQKANVVHVEAKVLDETNVGPASACHTRLADKLPPRQIESKSQGSRALHKNLKVKS